MRAARIPAQMDGEGVSVGLAMTLLRLAPGGGSPDDPRAAVATVFGHENWRADHDDDHVVDLDVRWQPLHYMLTGDAWDGDRPASDVVCGGVLFTVDDDLREKIGADVLYLSPERVAAAAGLLADFGGDRLLERMDDAAMKEAGVEGDTGGEDAVRADHDRLVAFYGSAAAAGQVVYKIMG